MIANNIYDCKIIIRDWWEYVDQKIYKIYIK